MPPKLAEAEKPTLGQAARYGRRALGLVWRAHRGRTLAIAALTLGAATLPTLVTYLSKLIVDGVLAAVASGAAADRDAALGWVVAEALVLAALVACRRLLWLEKSLLHAELGYTVSRAISDQALALDLAQHEDPEVQQRMLLARQQAASRPYSMVNRLFEMAQHGVALLAFSALLWTFSPWAVAIVAVAGLPLFLGELGFSGRVFRFYQGRTPEMRERSYLESLMTGESTAAERLHYRSGPAVRQRYERLFEWLYGQDRALQARRAGAGLALTTLSALVLLGAKAWIVWATIAGAITLGQMTMYAGLVKQGQGAVNSLLGALGGVYEDLLYLSNLYAFLGIETPASAGLATSGPRPGDGLRLEDVSFTYPGSARPAVDAASLHLPPGRHVGLVGANGSGKTTLVKLIVGLYRPSSGRVTLDGLDLEGWDRDALAERIGVLFQPFVRYKLTARDNIAMGAGLEEVEDGRLLAAAERGLADGLIEELPRGLDTRLSRRFLDGRELSGGQWQRLALARAMLHDEADFLILDEPTAAMDAAAEGEFIRAFEQRRPGRTLLLISHRLANLRHADEILVLDAGRLVERGRHKALMEGGGVYARMFTTQAKRYAG